jgi:hypothetical protein
MLSDTTRPKGGGLYIIWLGAVSEEEQGESPSPSMATHYYYLGRTFCFQKRWGDHRRMLRDGKHDNPHMQRVFNTHGVFLPEVLSFSECEQTQVQVEQAWLDAHYGKPGCVNISPFAGSGWARGRRHSEATRKRLSEVATGAVRSDAHRKAISEGHKGITPSPKNKQATARANRERVWAPEMRKKASLSHKGLVKSEESVRKQKESWARTPGQLERARERAARNRPPAGRMVSSKARQRMSEAAKRRCQSRQGFLWVNNGDTAMFVSPDEARTLLAQGWLRGRIRKP